MSTTSDRPDPGYVRQLVYQHGQIKQRIKTLSEENTRLTLAVDHHRRTIPERINYDRDPENLAGAIELRSYATPDDARRMVTIYHWLLTKLADTKDPGLYFRQSLDFNKLPVKARPYLVAPFFDIMAGGKFPYLDFDKSDPASRLVYVHTGGPADLALWREKLPTISQWIAIPGSDKVWELTDSTVNTVTLTLRTPLPSDIRMDLRWLKKGHLFYGIDVETQHQLHVPIDQMTHTLVAGTPGMGKSVFLRAMLTSCLFSIDQFEHVYAVCGQGVAFERYRDIHPKLTVNNEPTFLYDLAAKLQATMKERTARLVAERKDKMGEYILLLIDEWGAFNNPDGPTKAEKEAHAAFIQNIQHLGKRGRKTGIRLMLVVQEPVDRDIATGVRSNLSSLVSFRLPLAAHGQALFGEITPPAVPADPRTLPIGRCLYHDGATSRRTLLHVPFIEPPRSRS